MSALRNLLLAAAAAVVAALLLVGITTPAGHGIIAPLGQAAGGVGGTLLGVLPSAAGLRRFAGNPLTAVAAGAVLIVVAVWLVPKARSGRGLLLTSILGAAAGLALYLGVGR